MVSILCPTFQHVDFVEDAIHGFLGQDTAFPFEVLIRDDASTDGTPDVVRDYAQRYPLIIRPILETVNRWPATCPLQELRARSQGDFVAICEGDDYWIDRSFLEKAVAILRSDETLAAVVSQSVIVRHGMVAGHERPKSDGRWNWYLPLRSTVSRSAIDVPRIEGAFGDQVLALTLQRSGQIRYIHDSVAVYRKHVGGLVSGAAKPNFRRLQAMSYSAIAVFLAESGDLQLAQRYQTEALERIRRLFIDLGIEPPRRFGPSATALQRSIDRIQPHVAWLRSIGGQFLHFFRRTR